MNGIAMYKLSEEDEERKKQPSPQLVSVNKNVIEIVTSAYLLCLFLWQSILDYHAQGKWKSKAGRKSDQARERHCRLRQWPFQRDF